jgi:predicted dehydrogenase
MIASRIDEFRHAMCTIGDSEGVSVTVKLVHVGLGGWGQDWELNAIPPVAQFDRVAWVDAHEPTLEVARKRLDLPTDRCFTSLNEAFSTVESDAVLITAPQVAHVPLAIEAMEAGKHVLVEKPFAISVDEAQLGVDVAQKTNRVLMVSQQYRHYPAVRKAAQIVREQRFGQVGSVRVDFRKWANSAPKEGHRHYLFPHPLIFDMAIHHFDLMRLILDREAVSVFARVTDPAWSKFEDEGAAVLTIEFEGGLIVSYRGSWLSPDRSTTWSGDWNIECERANLYFRSREGAAAGSKGDVVKVTELGKTEEGLALPAPRFHGRSAGLVAFAMSIATGEEPETSARNNLGSVALMEAAARAAASGDVEDVEQVR